jgi:hypothetical protein
MSCGELHAWARSLPRYRFPFDKSDIPKNGIYLLFEKGERAHKGPRITRVGTHTGEGQLPSRLWQHFVMANKDRSIFRKNIGRALLARDQDPFLTDWEIDLTTRAARDLHHARINKEKLRETEVHVSLYMQSAFSFVFAPVEEKSERLELESRIISTLSLCEECAPSEGWLGNFSPKPKIRESGLWIVNELYKEPLGPRDLARLPVVSSPLYGNH